MKIYKDTVSEFLWEILVKLMDLEILEDFRLVGGTSLSLLLGHRISNDIDLFTDSEYGTINFEEIGNVINSIFSYVEIEHWQNNVIGNTCFIGMNRENMVKVDFFYTDPFVFPVQNFMGIRLSKIEEIIAMKLQIIGNGGRKKDFWDIHELTNYYTIQQMLQFYLKRYPYSYSEKEILSQLLNFKEAEYDFDPICLKGKYWELIKLDFEEMISQI